MSGRSAADRIPAGSCGMPSKSDPRSHMLDARHLRHVVEVVDQRSKRRRPDPRRKLPVDHVRNRERYRRSRCPVRSRRRCMNRNPLGPARLPGLPPSLVDEGWKKVHHAHPAFASQRAQLVIRQVARRRCQRTRRRMARNYRRPRHVHHLPERLVRNMRNVHHHAQPIHLRDHLAPERCKPAVLRRFTARISPVIRIRPGQCHVTNPKPVKIAQVGQRSSRLHVRLRAPAARQSGLPRVPPECRPAKGKAATPGGARRTCSSVASASASACNACVPTGCSAGSTHRAKNSAARLPARAVAKLIMPVPSGSGKRPAVQENAAACRRACR